jgi:hypothetical protein
MSVVRIIENLYCVLAYCESLLNLLESGASFILVADYSNVSVIHSHLELVFDKISVTFVSCIFCL